MRLGLSSGANKRTCDLSTQASGSVTPTRSSPWRVKVRWATAADRWFDVSTDAFAPYENAIDAGLHDRANHSQVVKLFSHHIEPGRERYSPEKFIALAKDAISGKPDLDRACTSRVERKNGSLRQWCKRLTRLTYAFLQIVGESPSRPRSAFWVLQSVQAARIAELTPAMAAGVTDHVWERRELIA